MAEHGQTNIRIPERAKPLIHRLARLLREDPSFLHSLTRFVEEAGSQRASFIADRLERLEARVAELEAHAPAIASQPARERQKAPAAVVWTEGEGKGRRLTPEGSAEMRRLIEEGQTDRQISDAIGVRPFTVARQRARILGSSDPDRA